MSPESPESPTSPDNLLITKGLNSYNPLILIRCMYEKLILLRKKMRNLLHN